MINRLQEFEGISQKIANMIARFLGLYYGVTLKDWQNIDLPVDRHVARMFLRTGLVKPVTSKSLQRISSLKDLIIEKARMLSSSFPGALDEPAFEEGRDWCTKEKAYCDYSSEPCPLRKVCRKLIHLDVT